MRDYVDSYYLRTLADDRRWPPLTGRVAVDVCIVGGGLAGLTTALELQRRGRSVAVLEANRVGWGASGRNGGIVSPGFALGLTNIVRKVGLDDAVSLYRLSMQGVSFVRNTIRVLGIEHADMIESGLINVIRYDDADGLTREQELLSGKFGHEVEVWPTSKVRQLLQTERYYQALFDRSSFHFHPLNYARALAEEIDRQGGQLFEESPALANNDDGAAVEVRTPTGIVTAREIVYACGGYTGPLNRRLSRSILPIATYVVVTEPAAKQVSDVVRTAAAVIDNRRASDYYRILSDGRLLWGGRITTKTSRPSHLADLLLNDIRSVYPQLNCLRIAAAWSGLVGYATHMMPQLGRLDDRSWYCSGFGGHGVNTTAICGHLIATAIAENDDRYRLFSPFGLTWNGGPIGTAAVQITYWRYQLMDWLQERLA
ncbi:MAG: FAD-binding oxidoreductase [Alphaproteobacteria bacterium]|nr:FAD-binding oxidoreductase [Alphaproteobacteria bacterium]